MLPRPLYSLLVLLMALGCASPPPQPDQGPELPEGDPPKPPPATQYEPIDEATCRAWEGRGFSRRWLLEDGSWAVYPKHGAELPAGMVPGFQGSNYPNFKDAPPVNVPFGIDLQRERDANDDVAKELPALKNLVVLRLGYTGITDVGVTAITKIQGLTALELSGCYGITENGFKSLAALKNLRSLILWGSPVTDAAVTELATLENLTSLSVGGKNITDAGVKSLKPLTKLTSLKLTFAHVTDAGVAHLADLRNLSTVGLSNTKATDAGAKQLAAMKRLTELDVSYTALTDAGVKDVATLPNLTSLNLEKTGATDEGVKRLKALTRLQSLTLTHTKVTDVGVRELASLTDLTYLDVSATKVTDAGLKELAPLKKLTMIIVPSEPGFPETSKALPHCKLKWSRGQ